jgi:DNA-binding SARP family transcriptional activator
MSLALRIQLFSEFSVTYNDRPVAGLSTVRSQALLAYLVLHRYTPQPRQRIAFHLWSDSTDAQARTNLRKELSYLRRNLPDVDQFLLVEAKTLQWSPTAEFTLDVLEFENAVKAAQTADPTEARSLLEQATQLYRGDLLPSCEDEWILPERERLQQMRVSALEQLIDLLKQQHDYRTAIGYAQQLLRIDSLNESTYVVLMQLHRLSGDRANALQVYHRCMTLLREELGVDPGATTRKLYEQLLREDELQEDESAQNELQEEVSAQLTLSPRPISPARSVSPLVGREPEWEMLQCWIKAIASDPSPQVLLLIGEPGIGKTRLLEELREMMQVEQGQVLWGRAFAAEMVRPYGIWIDALRSLQLPATMIRSVELGFLLPEIDQPGTAPPDRSHLFDAVVRLLAEWANQAPLLVILDDLQWIDEASSALLHYAIRLLSHLPVRFACTARTTELKENVVVSQVVQTLRRERRLKTVEVSPLNREQTAALVRSFKAVEPAELSIEVIDRVFIDSGGNPLFALEVARALSQDQSTQVDDLEALIGDRLEKLDDAARDLLPWAAALGRSFKPAMVAQVADYPMTQLLTAIEQLERQSIIRPSTRFENEMGYDFIHDIVRRVVYRQISEPRRHLIHLQIAHKLNQRATSDNALSGDIAHHASLGGDHELAASAALLAGDRCLKLFAYAEAATLAQRGIEHCQFLDERTRIRLHLDLLRVLAIAGVTGDRATQLEAEVHQLMGEANRLGLKDDEAVGFGALWILYFNQSNFARLESHSMQAVEVSRVVSPVRAAQLLAYSGGCLAEIGREMVRAEALLLEAQSLAARVGLQLCDIDSGLGSVHYHNGRYDEARPLLQRACKQAQHEQDHWRGCTYLSYLAMLELEAGNLTAALPYCEEMASVAVKMRGGGSEGAIAAALAALINYRLQQPGADTALEQAITTLKQVDAKRMLSYILIGAAETDLERDRPQLAIIRTKTALQAALIIDHPSEIALAWAMLIQGFLTVGESEQAIAQFEALRNQIDYYKLSTRAQTAVNSVMQQMQSNLRATPDCFKSDQFMLGEVR